MLQADALPLHSELLVVLVSLLLSSLLLGDVDGLRLIRRRRQRLRMLELMAETVAAYHVLRLVEVGLD